MMMDLRALAILLAICFLPARSPAQTKPQPFNPQDMLNVVEFIPGSEPVLSPDGMWVAYATKDPSLESNILSAHSIGFLWVAKLGEKPSRIAEGANADTPVWSPDGHELAFIRTSKERSQLCVWNARNRQSARARRIFSAR